MSTGGMTNRTVLVPISTLLLRRKRYLCYHLFFMIPRGDLPTLEERIRYNKTDKSLDLWLLALGTHESHFTWGRVLHLISPGDSWSRAVGSVAIISGAWWGRFCFPCSWRSKSHFGSIGGRKANSPTEDVTFKHILEIRRKFRKHWELCKSPWPNVCQ